MKLRNIYIACEDNYDAIEGINGKDIVISGRSGIRVSGWDEAKHALEELRELPVLESEVDALINAVPAFYRNLEDFSVSTSEWNVINSARNMLSRTMADIMALYEKMNMNLNRNIGLDIKLPQYQDFSEFVKHMEDIEFVLTKCPFLQSTDETLEFQNVDVGSTWLTFFVAGASITMGSVLLNNVAAFVDKCIIIRNHYLTVQKQKQDLEHEKRSNEEKQVIMNYLDELYRKERDIVIADLENITGYKVENKDGDEVGRIEQCFAKLGVLIDKGLQMYSNIDSPDEVKALFQPLEMKYLEIVRAKDLLEDKKEE